MPGETASTIVPHPLQPTKCHLVRALIAGIFLVYGCGKEDEGYRSYYFPLAELEDGMVYVYEPVLQLGFGTQIWLLQSTQTDTGRVLSTRIYDNTHTLVQEVRELEVQNGTVALSYTRYLTDSSGQIMRLEPQILRRNLFPYEVADTSRVFAFQLRYPEPGDPTLLTTRTRYRRLKGMDQITLAEGDFPALVFALKEKIEVEQEGFLTLEYSGEEVYARGIGLAAWQQIPQPGDTILYRLAARQSREEYEKSHGTLP